MSITFNTALGLLSGLAGMVVGLATMLLVVWQAPTQRDNRLMVLYMASVAILGMTGMLLNIAVAARWDLSWPYRLFTLMIGVNSYISFIVATSYAEIRDRLPARLLITMGAIAVFVTVPLVFADQVVVLNGVTPDGLYIYSFVPTGVPFIILLMLYSLGALWVAWRYRQSRAGQLLAGYGLIVGANTLNLLPYIGAYSLDVLASALASLMFARAILQEQLFSPLARANAELAASNARLTVLSEGLQLTADELRRARDAAEAANIAKSKFLATMSHELRTPLTSIIGYSDLMRAQIEQSGSVNEADLETIGRAGYHLLRLINDVLDVAKIEAGKVELELSTFALRPLVDDLTRTMLPLASANGNTLAVRCGDEIGTIVSDPTRLRQILLNLLGNAVKYTEGGTITLGATRVATAALEWIIFAVADTGIGMTPEQTAMLFQTFTQADSSLTRKYGGAGLGLALSQGLCRMLGGEIRVTSAPGAGSTFYALIQADARLAEDPGALALWTDQAWQSYASARAGRRDGD